MSKESSQRFAEMTVDALLMGQDAINGYARQIGGTSKADCPIMKHERARTQHANISLFVQGGGLISWECPFCGERFSV